jgi:hypothetical protein
MTAAERKRRWRQDPANRERENEAHRRRRDRPDARLYECMRDTLRHQRNRVNANEDLIKAMYGEL